MHSHPWIMVSLLLHHQGYIVHGMHSILLHLYIMKMSQALSQLEWTTMSRYVVGHHPGWFCEAVI